MTLRDCIEKLPNNSILTISKNKKLDDDSKDIEIKVSS